MQPLASMTQVLRWNLPAGARAQDYQRPMDYPRRHLPAPKHGHVQRIHQIQSSRANAEARADNAAVGVDASADEVDATIHSQGSDNRRVPIVTHCIAQEAPEN